jgi:hypothetical protein
MTMAKGGPRSHVESFDAKRLRVYIEKDLGGVLNRQVGSHLKYDLPNGAVAPCLDKGAVPTRLAAAVASAAQVTIEELRQACGASTGRHGKISKKVVRHTAAPPGTGVATKGATLALVKELRDQLTAIDKAVRPGQRDPAFYQRVYGPLVEARNALGATEAVPS